MEPAALTTLEQTIARITRLVASLEAHAFQQAEFSNLSMRQVLYLETISRLGHPSFGELAQALGVTRPSVTTLVGRLIRAGYVQKVQDDQDRRSYHILLTDRGLEFTRIHDSLHRQIVQTLVAHLDGREVEQLAALLDKALGG